MNRNQRFLLIAGGAALAVLAMMLTAVWLLGARGGDPDAGMFARLQNGLSNVTSGIAPSQPGLPRDFAFRRLDVDVSKAQPEACLVFTRALDASGKTRYEDYLTLDPVVRVASRVVDTRLCLSGLAFDKTYNVTLKTGLSRRQRRKAGSRKKPCRSSCATSLRWCALPVASSCRATMRRACRSPPSISTADGEDHPRRRPSAVADRNRVGGPDHALFLGQQAAREQPGRPGVAGQHGGRRNVKNDSVVTLIPIRDLLKEPQARRVCADRAGRRQEARQ
jgi:hypothetical protein